MRKHKYRIRCLTEEDTFYTGFQVGAPTECPNDSQHEIDVMRVDPIERRDNWNATSAPTVNDDETDGYSEGSKWVDVQNHIEYCCMDGSTGEAVWEISAKPGLEGVFGTEFRQAESEGLSTTTSENPIEKVKLATGSIPAGNYIIMVSYEFNGNKSGSRRVKIRVQIDDTETIHELEYKMVDDDNWNSKSMSKYVALDAGSHEIDLDYWTDNDAMTVSIKRARIHMWRVS